ncbi:MAG: hypothetical protein R2736_20635 [Solirubrobacterales bacterium]
MAAQARAARALRADPIVAVGTAAIRAAPNCADLVAAVRVGAGVELAVLDAEREARYAFAGATRTCRDGP